MSTNIGPLGSARVEVSSAYTRILARGLRGVFGNGLDHARLSLLSRVAFN